MSISRLTTDQRTAIIMDLLDLDFPLEEIVEKYGVGSKTIYLVANRFGLDMALRRRLVKMRAERKRLTAKIETETRKLRTSVIVNRK